MRRWLSPPVEGVTAMDEKKPRDDDVELRAGRPGDDEHSDILDDLARRREQQRRALTERERTERWPTG